ncbi:ComF family protein [Hyphomonas johnsonii]|uniref:ComF family protein n=1 Tax=Hyphomonas johnsonii MHS-2 TaxID=1280950 RepID=A0A059FPP2_9PROT|nr:ComF family protein [Hyphomonas johnsonii]KCZ92438.1 ComF family protein [Hyphomonas johnsonii MHS-2]
MQGDMDRSGAQAKGFLRGATDFLWPPRSLVSGQRGVGKGPLAPDEFAQIHFLTGPVCDRCGSPLGFDMGEGAACAPCIARPPRWHRARAAMVYDAASRRPVLDLKRSGRRDGLETLAGWMQRAGSDLLAEADILVPVPLHYSRLVRRGFNQSGWLAAAISRRSGTPFLVDALKRTRRTPTQGGLSARARRRNVAGAFTINKRAAPRISGRRVLLVDDVLTTGATLSACTRALTQAGAIHVDVLVLARVVRETDVTI